MGFINVYLGVGPLYWIETIAGIVIFTGLIAYDVNRIKWQSYQLADGDNEAMEKMSIDGAFSHTVTLYSSKSHSTEIF